MSNISEDFFKELEDVAVYKLDENTNKKSPDDPDVIASAICSSLAFLGVECPECHGKDYVKFGRRQKMFKDIPFDNQKTAVNVNRERLQCKRCGAVFPVELKCMNIVRKMTNRLYDYVVLRCQETSYKNITNETGLSRRTLQYMASEYLDANSYILACRTTILIVDKWKGKDRYVILNGWYPGALDLADDEDDNYEVLGVSKSKDAAISRILKYHYMRDKILIPRDKYLTQKLVDAGIPKSLIDYEYDSYCNYIVGKIFEAYIRDRKINKKDIKTPLDVEKKVFFQRINQVGPEDRKVIDDILNVNNIFRTYYVYKERFLDSLKARITNINKGVSSRYTGTNITPASSSAPNKTATQIMNFMSIASYTDIYEAESIISTNISVLLDEIEQNITNIKILSPEQSEKSKYLFKNICTDMDNGVLEEWVCYKYNKQLMWYNK